MCCVSVPSRFTVMPAFVPHLLFLACLICVGQVSLFPLRMEELACSYGFEYENHTLTTEDGYILTIGRLPPRSYGCSTSKGIVLLGHGISQNGELHLLKSDSLAYELAKECYDVWLANNRGTRYSNRHVKLTVTDREFWDFSHDEMALFDLKNIIDYIRKLLGKRYKIHYVGFSQATNHFLILCSEKPEYQNCIKSAHLLAPFMGVHDLVMPKPYTSYNKLLDKMLQIPELVIRPLVTSDGLFSQILLEVCVEDFKPVCGVFTRKECPNQNDSVLWSMHFPDAFPLRSAAQFHQWIISDSFRKYDHGKELNIQVYGKEEPPHFNVEGIKTKTFVYHTLNDPYSSPEMARRLVDRLPNGVIHPVNQSRIGHGNCPSDGELGLERLDGFVLGHINEINDL